ncbi:unnamed protein product [Owenia fusiformis]|nr:unnamed protein product [Owenia fusiformis]
MDTICAGRHYVSYEYIPPKMVKLCQYITEKDPESMEDLLLEHYKTENRQLKELEKVLCVDLIETCLEDSPSRSEYETRNREQRGSTKARVVNMDGSEKEFDVPLANSQEDIDKKKKERAERKKKAEEIEKKEEL